MVQECTYAWEKSIDDIFADNTFGSIAKLADIRRETLLADFQNALNASSEAVTELRRVLQAMLHLYLKLCDRLSPVPGNSSEVKSSQDPTVHLKGHGLQVRSCLTFGARSRQLLLAKERLPQIRDDWEQERLALTEQLRKDKEWLRFGFQGKDLRRDKHGYFKPNQNKFRDYLLKRAKFVVDPWGIPIPCLVEQACAAVVDTDLWSVAGRFDSMLAKWIRLETVHQCLFVTRERTLELGIRHHLPHFRWKLKHSTLQELVDHRLLDNAGKLPMYMLRLPGLELRSLAAVWTTTRGEGPLASSFKAGKSPIDILSEQIATSLRKEPHVALKARDAGEIAQAILDAGIYGVGLETIQRQLRETHTLPPAIVESLYHLGKEIFPEFAWWEEDFHSRIASNLGLERAQLLRMMAPLDKVDVRRGFDSCHNSESLQALVSVNDAWRRLQTTQPDGSYHWRHLINRVSDDGSSRRRCRGLPHYWTAPHLDHADDFRKSLRYQILEQGFETLVMVNEFAVIQPIRPGRADPLHAVHSCISELAQSLLANVLIDIELGDYP
jgi:hypothetical protein